MPPALPPKLRIARWISIVGHPFVLSLLVAAAFCNRWLKVSLHAAFAAFTVVSLWNVSLWAAGLVLVLAVAIGWSRVVLGRHSLPEVLAGAGLGGLVATALLRPP